MDARLEAALLGVLDRAESGADVSEEWLRETYPDHWNELAGFLGFFGRLQRGRPRRETLGPYRILRRLGQGGMGAVYLAETTRAHEGLAAGTKVAVKVVHRHLLSRRGFLQRTLREARVGRSVVHENVVRTLDVGVETQDGVDETYLVTEYVEGQNLRGLLHEMEVLPEDLCRHVAREVLRGLVAIHAAGVVHRDLKPENVVVGRSVTQVHGGVAERRAIPIPDDSCDREGHVVVGRDDAVKVMDLGAARPAVEIEPVSEPADVLGSVLYAAPEQFASAHGPAPSVDGRADLYALGVVLHELAAGRHPFAHGGAGRHPARLGRENPAVSAFFEEFVATLTADDRDDRFATAAAALEALDGGDASSWWRRRSDELRAEARGALRHARGAQTTPFVGRVPELASLAAQFARAAAGEGRTVLVEGEAGVGKSRLVEEFAEDVRSGAAPARFLFASHPPEGAGLLDDAFVGALRGHFDSRVRADELTFRLGELAALAPAAAALLRGDAAPPDGPALTRESLPLALDALLRSLGAETPMVVVVEDLHFASADGRSLFTSLARSLADARVLLVGTSRPAGSDVRPAHWADGLAAAPHVTRLWIDRLAPPETRALLAAATGSDEIAAHLAPWCEQRSDGNPFFLVEILRALRDEGRLVPDGEGTWRLRGHADDARLPATIGGLVRARLAGLADEDRALLAAAACCGFEFEPAVAAEVAGVPAVHALRRFARLERRHRLVRSVGPRAVFDHHVVQEVLLADLAPDAAARLHAAVGEVLERRAAAGGTIHPALRLLVADQYLLAGDAARAGPHLPAAIGHLAARFQASAALALCDRALATAPGLAPATRLLVLRAKARCLAVLARRDEELAALREALRLATSLDGAGAAAAVRSALAACLDATGRHAEALAEGEGALADADRPEVRREALLVLASILGRLGRGPEALGHAERHLGLAEGTGDRETLVRALALMSVTLKHVNRVAESHAFLERAMAAHRGLPESLATVREVRLEFGRSLTALGRLDEAVPVLEEQVRSARRAGDRGDEIESLEALSLTHARLGRWDDATRTIRAAVDLAARTGDAVAQGECTMRHASILKWTGRWGEALERYDDALELYRRHGDRVGEATTRAYRAIQSAYLGEFRAARDDAEAGLGIARTDGFTAVLPLVLWALGLTTGDGPEPDAAALAESARLSEEGFPPAVRAEIALALAAAEFNASRPSAADAARRALEAARAANLASAVVLAKAWLAALGEVPRDEALAELSRHEEGLPVGRRLEARHVLWRLTGDRALLSGAADDLQRLRDGAPARCRDSLVTNVPLYAAVARAAGLVAGERGAATSSAPGA